MLQGAKFLLLSHPAAFFTLYQVITNAGELLWTGSCTCANFLRQACNVLTLTHLLLTCTGMIPQQADRGGSPSVQPQPSKPVCVLASYSHIDSRKLKPDSFDCMIEYALRPDDTARAKVAPMLDACACSQHIVLEVAPHAARAVQQSRGQDAAPMQAMDDDSSASEHSHMPAEEGSRPAQPGTRAFRRLRHF